MTKSQELFRSDDVAKATHPRAHSVTEPMQLDTKIRSIDDEDTDVEFACAEYAKNVIGYLKKREVLCN